MTRIVSIIVLFAIIAIGAITIFCAANGIWSRDDFYRYRMMRSTNEPIIDALADGTLHVGSTTREMLAIDSPDVVRDYGRCIRYSFAPANSYDYRTVTTLDGHIVAASVGSCTWYWDFFDELPEEFAQAIQIVRTLPQLVERNPQIAEHLTPMLEAARKTLAMPPAAIRSDGPVLIE
jgi:hypothetical protein